MLVALANALRKSFRDTDLIARVGGDEFMICYINNENSESFFNARIAETEKTYHDTYDLKIKPPPTLSYGSSTMKVDSNFNLDKLMNIVDQQMYADKTSKHCD